MWLAVYGFWMLLLCTVLSAFRWGGGDDRCVAAAYLAAAVATVLLRLPGYASVNVGVFAVDLGLLVVLLWLVIRTPRWWLIISAALQLATVMGHVAMSEGGTRPFAYFMTVVSSSYPAVAILAFAIWRTARSRTANARN